MHQVASDLNKAKREPFIGVVVVDRYHRDCRTGDSLQRDIFGWLSPPDPWKNHHAACESCHPGTAEWFIQGNTFTEWRTSEVPGSLLWVYGKRLLIPSLCGSTETKMFVFYWFRSGRWKKRLLVCEILYFHLGKTYHVRQLHNHRRHPCHAESWTRIISIFLL